eukprot:CAMPEP_0177268142 /NCGR_PEP_ID=MMETSP0367-20130122/63647_1 /TAXON_ID=447022 ORGANISM="Scrippsiella hangoei-like, Strain SHHI-4" /NCGR_SAMPLE_ID=MMETSP0367 /ASSEMBLY_ACC=CAM_ASM_000362 /LENGTH=228 /DNA_ID=CAMNT_0018723733 /DNA_START=159 /DNA_END=842 /DNA_ORIENTATION=-
MCGTGDLDQLGPILGCLRPLLLAEVRALVEMLALRPLGALHDEGHRRKATDGHFARSKVDQQVLLSVDQIASCGHALHVPPPCLARAQRLDAAEVAVDEVPGHDRVPVVEPLLGAMVVVAVVLTERDVHEPRIQQVDWRMSVRPHHVRTSEDDPIVAQIASLLLVGFDHPLADILVEVAPHAAPHLPEDGSSPRARRLRIQRGQPRVVQLAEEALLEALLVHVRHRDG